MDSDTAFGKCDKCGQTGKLWLVRDPDMEEPIFWNVPGSPMVVSVRDVMTANEEDLVGSVVVVKIACAGLKVLVEMVETEREG